MSSRLVSLKTSRVKELMQVRVLPRIEYGSSEREFKGKYIDKTAKAHQWDLFKLLPTMPLGVVFNYDRHTISLLYFHPPYHPVQAPRYPWGSLRLEH
ncbi:hypothetical protein TNCV_3072991 [Trichonephila clavipes]|nr:hypothetical protein TNCV_3072991 [Trichonephila clavipes]